MQGFGRILHNFYVETEHPPKPVPLTLGCMPVLFIGVGERPEFPCPSAGHFASPRIKNPCSHISWPRLSNPKPDQRTAILTAFRNLISVKGNYFLPSITMVKLTHNDDRIYVAESLPEIVAQRTTIYHYSEAPFFDSMRDLNRRCRLDPDRYNIVETSPLPEDYTNYLRKPPSLMTPGIRLSACDAPGSEFENASRETSTNVNLQNWTSGQEIIVIRSRRNEFWSRELAMRKNRSIRVSTTSRPWENPILGLTVLLYMADRERNVRSIHCSMQNWNFAGILSPSQRILCSMCHTW